MKVWSVRLGAPYPFFIGVPQTESIPFFWDGFLQRPASNFYQGLESNSYGHYRVFGGDQSLGACNSRVD